MADLAAEIPAYAAIGLAGLTFLWGEHRFRSTRRARQAAGPLPDTRAALEAARNDFDEILSLGGQTSDFFESEARRENGRRLRDLADRTGDRSLSLALLEVSIAWDNTWGHSMPAAPPRVINLSEPWVDTPEDETRRWREDLQVTVARDGQEKCASAIGRLNELERNVGH